MEQELMFDDILTQPVTLPTYCVVYDPKTGGVLQVGPDVAFKEDDHKLEISYETMVDLTEGKVKIQNCYVDPYTETLEVVASHSKSQKDIMLYRIPRVRYGGSEISEIYLTYDTFTSKLDIELSEVYEGTKVFFDYGQTRKPFWNDNTEVSFLVTDYNDPHVIYKILRFPLVDLIGNKKSIEIELPEKFNVYTTKVFKRYLIEIIDENSRV
jgi:hypothetical protein